MYMHVHTLYNIHLDVHVHTLYNIHLDVHVLKYMGITLKCIYMYISGGGAHENGGRSE